MVIRVIKKSGATLGFLFGGKLGRRIYWGTSPVGPYDRTVAFRSACGPFIVSQERLRILRATREPQICFGIFDG